jgi:H+/Cl- antiporter ClcA
MILGGGIVGREGPTVQIAAGIFRKIDQLIPDSWPRVSKRNMIISGAAAGLAAAFNTPLGGIVFAVEELAKSHISQFKTAIFTCVIIAGITAQAILGPYLYLGYPNVTGAPGYLFIFVALVAAIAGILSSFTNVAILKILKWKRTFTKMSYHLLYAAAVALILACIAYFFNMGIIGSGKAEMSRVLFTADKHVAFAFPFLKIIGTIACFTSGGAGGIFAPALGIGATLGTTIAELFHFTSSDANILILSGMVAFLTGITRSPFTSAILVLEMTDSQSVIFHLMLAGIISSLVSLLVDKHSLYEHIKGHLLAEVHKENSIGKDRKQLPPQAAPQNG